MTNPKSLQAAANFYKSAIEKTKDCNCFLKNKTCKCDA